MTFAVSATGSAGMEAAIMNVVEPGDTMVACVNGVFGGRMAEVADRAGAEVIRVERPWGQAFEAEDLDRALESKPKAVGIVMAETSTGVLQPIEEIAKRVRDAGALLIVDAVTSLGGVPVEVDAWGLDVVYSGSQKCLSCPPGLAPISFSTRAMEAIQQRSHKCRSWYFDVSLLANYWGDQRAYHHTAPINMTYALYEAVRLILEEGLKACHARHLANHRALRAGLEAMGLRYAAQAGREAPMLNAVWIPEGVDDRSARGMLIQRFGIEIGGGLGEFQGKAWRIGLMGHTARPANVLTFLAALEQVLSAEGAPSPPGAGIAAANAVYADQSG